MAYVCHKQEQEQRGLHLDLEGHLLELLLPSQLPLLVNISQLSEVNPVQGLVVHHRVGLVSTFDDPGFGEDNNTSYLASVSSIASS